MVVLQATGIKKSYRIGGRATEILRGVDFALKSGESVAIMGPSGSGKSTLLQILGIMAKPDDGSLVIGERDVLSLDDDSLSKFRRRELGFIFQKFNLISTLSARENVAWPLLIDGQKKSVCYARAEELLTKVGLSDRMEQVPGLLSGGEQQRVAIARSLVAKPKIVFADEPTGALDSKTGKAILEVLKKSVFGESGSLIMVTHDPHAAQTCDRTLQINDGLPC